MPGIERMGVYIPHCRLPRQAIAGQWGRRGGAGERSVANWDEDSLTLGVEAATACLAGVDAGSVDAVLFASTTFPYAEKQSAAVVAEALDLRPGIETLDVASSLRSAAGAVRLALDMVAGGRVRRVLVVAADGRGAPANSRDEPLFGDGAVALLVGPDAALLAVRPLWTDYSGVVDVWRKSGDRFVRSGDERFVQRVLYEDVMAKALKAGLAQAGLPAESVAAIALSAPDGRLGALVAQRAGLDPDRVAGKRIYEGVGHTGVAAAWLHLAEALERAQPGDRLLLGAYGDGVDVLLCEAGGSVADWQRRQPVSAGLAASRPLTYGSYLRYKQLVEEESVSPYTSEVALWRDHRYLIRLHAPRCDACGAIQYPPRRVCWRCRSKDRFTEVPLRKEGRLFTFTVEHLFPVPEGKLITAVVDLEDGARLYTQLIDCAPEAVEIGMPLRLCFRKVHEGGGFNHYFWKAQPNPE